MASHNDAYTEAVFLFEEDRLQREMLFSEFEAILDGVVPETGYANQKVKGAYLHINTNLCITAAVFFTIGFDSRGVVDTRWNLPLDRLASTAGRGPDLGAGPIRIASYSQCPVEWHQKHLWDPLDDELDNHFEVLRAAVQRNRLSVKVSPQESEDEPYKNNRLREELKAKYTQALRDRMAKQLREHRHRIDLINRRYEHRCNLLKREYQQRLAFYREQLMEERSRSRRLEQHVWKLRQQLARENPPTPIKSQGGF
ncbi:hypothetical protein [Marinimicrobium alkaliphilum]|uniref:hypothetical protein n=1 Tax=Marinimicrobium alkaliphilum TaxID=2202654 RepID=UPI000DBA6ECD|nr:hypothetical protein [Marinimicrobium alkaliphilum]